jgi:hypothetical protein
MATFVGYAQAIGIFLTFGGESLILALGQTVPAFVAKISEQKMMICMCKKMMICMCKMGIIICADYQILGAEDDDMHV